MRRLVSLSLPRKAILFLVATLLLGGAAFSVQAATLLPDYPNWITKGEETGDDYGFAVRGVGDLDNNGSEDILVGAPLGTSNPLYYQEGAAYAFLGTPKGLMTDYDWVGGSGQKGSRFGSALAGVGDVNQDGYADVLIGAHRFNGSDYGGYPGGGAAFLFYGSPLGPEPLPAFTILGDRKEAELGYAVDGVGDINTDGFRDLLVGVRYYTEEQFNEGQVRVYLGAADGFDNHNYWGFASEQSNASLGASVAGVGDLNSDGVPDFVAGAPFFNTVVVSDTISDAGAVYVFYGVEDGLPTEYDLLTGATQDEWFGAAVAAAGDLNQDGFDDLLVGAPGYDSPDLLDEGAVYIFLGSKDGLVLTPARIWRGLQTGSDFGATVSGAGDINQDGFLDVIVGAPLFTEDQNAEGGIFVFFGEENDLATDYSWRNYGQKADTLFGASVSAADVNGDVSFDVLVGAPKYRILNVDVGRAAAYYGGVGQVVDQVFLPLVVK